MAQSNSERVGKGLETLRAGLQPFVERQCAAILGARWRYEVANNIREEHIADSLDDDLDTQALLVIMWNMWNTVFSKVLGHSERNYVSELRTTRNNWAHQKTFTTDDAYRALDTMERMLKAIAAPEAVELERQKAELLRVRYEESAQKTTRRATRPLEAGTGAGSGLRPWRELVTPHKDVATGRYQQAEFMADLGQVARQEGTAEYSDPREFFQRTYITAGLRGLLVNALRRLNGAGGNPVVELQTNFGGGKTHSMLALYHLFSGVSAHDLYGMEPVLLEAEVANTVLARRVVLSGQAISPGQPSIKPDGTAVRTLWGELAWQLGHFDRVAGADATGTNPGSDALREILSAAAPVIILIDEWVTHARQLFVNDHFPGGSFDANMTFAQALTEAARAVPTALVVASLPASDTEVGGDGGHQALARLQQVFGRIESPWRPAGTEEGYAIVRRRLFQSLDDPDLKRQADAVVRAFGEFYASHSNEFPAACREDAYRRRIQATYPFHPELFDRLYSDWCQLDRFQQTRGVLRLMAAVIAALWESGDRGLLIMPGAIPLDHPNVQNEIMHNLDLPWRTVIEEDVVELPRTIDLENPTLNRYEATQRVARTIFMGSAPVAGERVHGLSDQQIKLGAAQPGEGVATYGDALRRLTDRSARVYSESDRVWYATQTSVLRLAQDRAAQYSREAVLDELRIHLRAVASERGEFPRVQVCPPNSADIPDEREVRLIVLDPTQEHVARSTDTPALRAIHDIQEHRGNSPRYYKNMLVYLAADRVQLAKLMEATRLVLAWRSIVQDRETLDMGAYQMKLADAKQAEAAKIVQSLTTEAYIWLIVPSMEDGTAPTEYQELKLSGKDPIVVRASKKLRDDGALITTFAGSILRMELQRYLWRNGNHIMIRQLVDDFATYLYLPRLRTPDVLHAAICDGLKASLSWEEDGFAYADSYDDAEQRYRGLRLPGEPGPIVLEGTAVLVRPAAALAQRNAEAALEAAARQAREAAHIYTTLTATDTPHAGPLTNTAEGGPSAPPPTAQPGDPPPPRPKAPEGPAISRLRRFHGHIDLNALRMGRDAGAIAEGIIAQLQRIPGADITISLEIAANFPDGAPDPIVRAVLENAQTLKFGVGEYGFEEE